MTTIVIRNLDSQNYMAKLDENELSAICGGGPIRDFLHVLVDVICNRYGL